MNTRSISRFNDKVRTEFDARGLDQVNKYKSMYDRALKTANRLSLKGQHSLAYKLGAIIAECLHYRNPQQLILLLTSVEADQFHKDYDDHAIRLGLNDYLRVDNARVFREQILLSADWRFVVDLCLRLGLAGLVGSLLGDSRQWYFG